MFRFCHETAFGSGPQRYANKLRFRKQVKKKSPCSFQGQVHRRDSPQRHWWTAERDLVLMGCLWNWPRTPTERGHRSDQGSCPKTKTQKSRDHFQDLQRGPERSLLSTNGHAALVKPRHGAWSSDVILLCF